MSRDVFSVGWIAELEVPLDEDLRDEVGDKLWDLKSLVGVNYEGTLLVVDLHRQSNRYDPYNFTLGDTLVDLQNKSLVSVDPREGTTLESIVGALPRELADLLRYKPNRVLRFTEVWYNGVDSQHNSLTLEQFRSRFA